MPRGLNNPNLPQAGGGDYIKTIRLMDDGESCRIRFLNDKDDIFFEWQHRKMEGGQFRGFQVCPRAAFEQNCDDCDSGDDKRRAQLQFFAWVWEYSHDFPQDKEGREAIKIGRKTLYREIVGEVKLMRYAGTHKTGLEYRSDTIGTLIDRDYDWIRAGEKGTMKPTYMLEPVEGTTAVMNKELVEVAADLPDLEDVAFTRVTTLNKIEKADIPYGEEEVSASSETPF